MHVQSSVCRHVLMYLDMPLAMFPFSLCRLVVLCCDVEVCACISEQVLWFPLEFSLPLCASLGM